MAGPYGVTPQGFNRKPLSQTLSDMQGKQLARISPSLDVQPTALLGVLNGIVGAAVDEVWQLGGALYSGMNPDAATGDQLTSDCLLTGTRRDGAQPTEALGCIVNVNAGFDAPPGTMLASIVGNPTAIFKNKTEVKNAGGTPSNETVDFEAVNPGPQQCLSGTLTVIAQTLAGWNSITNPTDGIVGANIEDDPALRTRRNLELSAAGSTTAAAIRADVLETLVPPTTTSNTTGCTVLYNDTDITDANGLPPHSIEVIARQPGSTGADDIALATLILNSKAAGVGTHGTAFKLVKDSQGNTEAIYYTRPADIDLYIAITVVTDPDTFPVDGVTQIKNALLNYATGEYQPGVEVRVLPLQGSIFPDPIDPTEGVAGVLDITVFKIDIVPIPVNAANIPIDIRHIAALDSSRIAVTVT